MSYSPRPHRPTAVQMLPSENCWCTGAGSPLTIGQWLPLHSLACVTVPGRGRPGKVQGVTGGDTTPFILGERREVNWKERKNERTREGMEGTDGRRRRRREGKRGRTGRWGKPRASCRCGAMSFVRCSTRLFSPLLPPAFVSVGSAAPSSMGAGSIGTQCLHGSYMQRARSRINAEVSQKGKDRFRIATGWMVSIAMGLLSHPPASSLPCIQGRLGPNGGKQHNSLAPAALLRDNALHAELLGHPGRPHPSHLQRRDRLQPVGGSGVELGTSMLLALSSLFSYGHTFLWQGQRGCSWNRDVGTHPLSWPTSHPCTDAGPWSGASRCGFVQNSPWG